MPWHSNMNNAYRISDFQGFSKTPNAKILFIILNWIPRFLAFPSYRSQRASRTFRLRVGRRLAMVVKSLGKLFEEVYSGSPGSVVRHAILRGTELDALIAAGFPRADAGDSGDSGSFSFRSASRWASVTGPPRGASLIR